MEEAKILLSSLKQGDAKEVEEAILESKKIFGENTLGHILRVAKMVEERGLGTDAIIASIMQEAVVEKKMTVEEVEQKFGKTVSALAKEAASIAEIIDKNFGKIPADTLASLVLSVSTDYQTIIIRIADVVDLVELPAQVKKEDIKKLVGVAQEIYLPLVMKLGVGGGADWRIQDWCFRIENPQGHAKIKALVNKTREDREAFVRMVQKEVEELLKGKVEVQVFGRPKGFKAIFEKLKKTPFKQMHDLYGIRIICNKEKECYEILGYIHSKYDIIPEAFDDYISRPKSNGYKSIHTAVKRGNDTIEFQIRTWTHHLATESGLYWEYKRLRKSKDFEKELSWERQLVEWQKSLGGGQGRKMFSGKRVFVFTPKHEVINLQNGATALDFAYAVHTDVGKRAEKAKVNGKFVPLDSKLKNLDQVEIIVSEKPQIKKTWLNFAITDKAKNKIKSYFGLKGFAVKKKMQLPQKDFKKIKLAECCHPLPGEDVVGVKTTKRKIIMHKKDCVNIKKLAHDKLIEIEFERDKGKTEIVVTAIDRLGLLAEILEEIKKSGATLISTNFSIKKTGYVEAIFGLEVTSVAKLDNLMDKISKIPSVHGVDRR